MDALSGPDDLSGGLLYWAQVAPGYTHVHRFHVIPFSDSGVYVGGGADLPVAGYSTEATIEDTISNFINVAKGFMPTDTQLVPMHAVAIVGGVLNPLPHPLTTAPVTGTDGNPIGVSGPANEVTFNFHDDQNKPAKFIFFRTPYWDASQVQSVIPSWTVGGSLDVVQKFAAYITRKASEVLPVGTTYQVSAIVSHNGRPLVGNARITSTLNERLRRAYKLV